MSVTTIVIGLPLSYRLLRMFQYNLVATKYRGNDDQELQGGEIPTNACPTARLDLKSHDPGNTVRTGDRTRMG